MYQCVKGRLLHIEMCNEIHTPPMSCDLSVSFMTNDQKFSFYSLDEFLRKRKRLKYQESSF